MHRFGHDVAACQVTSAFCVLLRWSNMVQLQIAVRSMDNKTYHLNVEDSDTIKSLKEKLAEKTGTVFCRSAEKCMKHVCRFQASPPRHNASSLAQECSETTKLSKSVASTKVIRTVRLSCFNMKNV